MNSTTPPKQGRGSRLIRWVLHAIAIIAVAALLIATLIWVPRYQINQDVEQERIQPEAVPEQVDRYRRTLAQIFGGIAILAGLYFTHRRLLATERNVEIARENQEATERQVEIAREGQITERFTRAIEQLGDEDENRLAMRLGGIYALERIARDSERDHWTVMEVLTAFVRESAPVEEKGEQGVENPFKNIVAPDVQAALTVIGRRNTDYDPEGRVLNLNAVSVPGAELGEANLAGASLIGANLGGAGLGGTNLVEAELILAKLNWAYLDGAKLNRAKLNGAELSGADLTGASYELKQLAAAASVEGIKGLSDEELAELERLRRASE